MKNRNIYAITVLVGIYVTLQLIADVAAVKIVDIWGITMPAGTFIFALTFTWRDMLHKRLGKEWARAAIITAAAANLLMAFYFLFAIELNPAIWWGGQEAFEGTLGIVWRIAIASIVAELVSELLDTEVYHWAMSRISNRNQWGRVLLSNAISLPMDSIIFATIAFYGVMPFDGIVELVVGQIIFKAMVTVVSLPLIYTVPDGKLLEQS